MSENTNLPSSNPSTNLIRQYIINHYRPAVNYLNATVKLSTVQLHTRLLAMFPDTDMTVADLYIFLREQDFQEAEIRPFQSEWLFDKKEEVL